MYEYINIIITKYSWFYENGSFSVHRKVREPFSGAHGTYTIYIVSFDLDLTYVCLDILI